MSALKEVAGYLALILIASGAAAVAVAAVRVLIWAACLLYLSLTEK